MRRYAIVVAGLWLAANALADTVILRVQVTATSGRSVFIDHGQNDGIKPNDPITFFPPETARLDGFVREVSTDTARVEMPPGLIVPPAGTQGEIEVPAPEKRPEPAVRPREDVPEHDPWTRPT